LPISFQKSLLPLSFCKKKEFSESGISISQRQSFLIRKLLLINPIWEKTTELLIEDKIVTELLPINIKSLRPLVSDLQEALLANLLLLGSRLLVQYTGKKCQGPRSETGAKIAGVPALRSHALSRLNRRARTVNRAYGGSKTHTEVRNRIVRAFLVEEVKLLKASATAAKTKADKPKKEKKSKGDKKK